MTIHLTPDLEQLVRDKAAECGMDADGFVSQVLREALETDPSPDEPNAAEGKRRRRPISERFEEIRAQAPEEVRRALQELPTDFAAEHDHYLYGAAKSNS